MPLRVERFNDNGRHPNKFVAFIKENRRDTTKEEQARALGVLNRVAAIVYPIMKDNGLQVTTLEEHPCNLGYLGINYDAGDCIGLVLRNASGGWVSEIFVLYTMLHELSHCTNMHHQGPFWKTLGLYKARMRQLQQEGYTGEGFWRKGIVLGTGDQSSRSTTLEDEMPKALCGGAHRGFRRRRKRKQAAAGPSAKRIKPGQKLGGDLEMRSRLEGGHIKATPRVVKSKRGKELRATAAELRFSAQLTEQSTEAGMSNFDDYEEPPKWKYEDEDKHTQSLLHDEMKNEIKALRQTTLDFKPHVPQVSQPRETPSRGSSRNPVKVELSDTTDEDDTEDGNQSRLPPLGSVGVPVISCTPRDKSTSEGGRESPECPICTLQFDSKAIFCDGCGTLKEDGEDAWRCLSIDCAAVGYLNHVDNTLCGFCGSRRSIES